PVWKMANPLASEESDGEGGADTARCWAAHPMSRAAAMDPARMIERIFVSFVDDSETHGDSVSSRTGEVVCGGSKYPRESSLSIPGSGLMREVGQRRGME